MELKPIQHVVYNTVIIIILCVNVFVCRECKKSYNDVRTLKEEYNKLNLKYKEVTKYDATLRL